MNAYFQRLIKPHSPRFSKCMHFDNFCNGGYPETIITDLWEEALRKMHYSGKMSFLVSLGYNYRINGRKNMYPRESDNEEQLWIFH